jgi:hypothetical protein
MLDTPDTLTCPVSLLVNASTGEAEIGAELRYDPADPFAVSLVIGADCPDAVTWVFARDLLSDGLNSPSGTGDITVEPGGLRLGRPVLRITLSTDSVATMLLSTDAAMEFLMESFVLVPSGSEADHIDFDSEISALLD